MTSRQARAAPRTRIYGVDFSGAADAGKRIWVTRGTAVEGALVVQDCLRGEALPGAGRTREACLTALRRLIAEDPQGAFGLDFPFGLPQALLPSLLGADSWEASALGLREWDPGPEGFRRACLEAAGGREWKRVTDAEARTPFSPYNLRLYRQTYHGIRDLLAPLVQEGRVRVLPMQPPAPDRPWVMEICPACRLRRLGLRLPYKGGSAAHKEARRRILAHLVGTGTVRLPSGRIWDDVLQDRGGDGLDSLLAAVATLEAARAGAWGDLRKVRAYRIEGHVFV